MDRLRNMLALNDGKRIYMVKDGDVQTEDFEYCHVLNQILFGGKGLAETLGPTWEMIHDPRFEVLESMFIVEKPNYFGGDTRTGVQHQNADGTFNNGAESLKHIAEILGEGRFLSDCVISRGIMDRITTETAFSDRSFHFDPKDSHFGLKMVGPYPISIIVEMYTALGIDQPKSMSELLSDSDLSQRIVFEVGPKFFAEHGILSHSEKLGVLKAIAEGEDFNPACMKDWSDGSLMSLMREEYTNYFFRNGKINPTGATLLKLIRADLVGLVSSYAPIANFEEKILLDDPNTLYEADKHGDEVNWVSAEVEALDRALTYRAEMRVTAARILRNYGIKEDQLVDLTDKERDTLLQLIYRRKWPDEATLILTDVMSFLGSIKATGTTAEERTAAQLLISQKNSRAHCARLVTGELAQISRHTEEVVDVAATSPEDAASEAMTDLALSNPLVMAVFLRLSDLEARLGALWNRFVLDASASGAWAHRDGEPEAEHIAAPGPEVTFQAAVADGCTVSSIVSQLTDDLRANLETLTHMGQAVLTLQTAFDENPAFVWTEESVENLLAKVEALDPTPVPVVEQHEGVYAPEADFGGSDWCATPSLVRTQNP